MSRRRAGANYADEPWFKLQRRIFRSSVWEEDPATKVVWITLIGLAQLPENRKHGHGVVLITRGNLSREAFVTAEQLDHALGRLTAPDPGSRTEPGAGRLEILPNGYRLRSFELYHDAEEYDAWRAQRIAAGKARAAKARRAEEASGRGGRGRFTSGKPAVAGTEPAKPLVSTRKTETLTLTLTNGERTESPVGDPTPAPTEPGSPKLATKDTLSRECERFLESFQLAFARQRRAAVNPKLAADFGARTREGWTAAQIIAAPFIEAQSLQDRDDRAAREILAECQPSHLLRDGKHARTTKQGFTAGATHRLGAAYERAPQIELSPRLVRSAQELGVWETLQAAGVTAETDS